MAKNLFNRLKDFWPFGQRDHRVTVKRVTKKEELLDCANFFVEVCADKRGYFQNTFYEREQMFQGYLQHRKTVYAAMCKGKIVATLAVMTEIGEEHYLQIDDLFPEAREYMRGGRAQITNLAARPNQCGEKVFLPLMSEAMLQILASGNRNLQIMINPRHRVWYERKLGFRTLAGGEVREHSHLKQAPAIGMYFNMDWCSTNQFISRRLLQHVLLLGS